MSVSRNASLSSYIMTATTKTSPLTAHVCESDNLSFRSAWCTSYRLLFFFFICFTAKITLFSCLIVIVWNRWYCENFSNVQSHHKMYFISVPRSRLHFLAGSQWTSAINIKVCPWLTVTDWMMRLCHWSTQSAMWCHFRVSCTVQPYTRFWPSLVD